MPVLSGSASVKNDTLTLSITNCHANLPVEAQIELADTDLAEAPVKILSDEDVTAHNTFEQPNRIAPREKVVNISSGRHVFPAASVSVLTVKLR